MSIANTITRRIPGGSAPEPTEQNYLYLTTGQSNIGTPPATGRVAYAEMPAYLSAAQTNVLKYNTGTDAFAAYTHPSGQDWGFVNEMLFREAARLEKNIYWATWGDGGSRLSDITGFGAVFRKRMFLNVAIPAIAKIQTLGLEGLTIVIVHTQGYSDSGAEQTSLDYYENGKDFYEQLREIFDIPSLRVFYERVHEGVGPSPDFSDNVRAGQGTLDGITNNIMLDSDGWELQDLAHYSDVGSIQGGQDLSAAIASENPPAAVFGNRVWLPMDLTPYLWYSSRRVDVTNTQLEITDSAGTKLIKRLIDWGFNSVNVLQSTDARKPILVDGGTANAKITTDSARALISTSESLSQDFCAANFEMFFLVDITDGQPGALRVLFEAVQTDDLAVFINASNLLTFRINNGNDIFITTSSAPFADGANSKVLINVSADYVNDIAKIRINGVEQTVTNGDISSFNPAGFAPGIFTLFNRDTYSATLGWNGALYDCMIVPKILSTTERNNYHAFLNAQYGTSL